MTRSPSDEMLELGTARADLCAGELFFRGADRNGVGFAHEVRAPDSSVWLALCGSTPMITVITGGTLGVELIKARFHRALRGFPSAETRRECRLLEIVRACSSFEPRRGEDPSGMLFVKKPTENATNQPSRLSEVSSRHLGDAQ